MNTFHDFVFYRYHPLRKTLSFFESYSIFLIISFQMKNIKPLALANCLIEDWYVKFRTSFM